MAANWLMKMHTGRFPVALSLLAAGGLASVIWKWSRCWSRRQKLTRKRKKKQEERHLALEKLQLIVNQSHMTKERADIITSLNMLELLAQLRDGRLKATEVLHAYQLIALLAHQKTNCLVEPIFEAEAWAAELDQIENKGPLHGLPISIKDCMAIKGYDSTIGCSQYIDQPFLDDAVLVKVLKKQGAVPFVKTNIPQTMISWDSSNPIFGRVLNPYDLTRTPGGSSSGEAALIAFGGSICGFGTDIGGSIRIPSALCGLCGLKPTGNRISKKGRRSPLAGQNNVVGAWGPLARDVDSLITIMRGILDAEMYLLDPSIPTLPFRNEILNENRKLRIGYFDFNGVMEVVPCVARAVHETKQALEAAGHEMIPWNSQMMFSKAVHIWAHSMFADAGQEFVDILSDDEVDNVMKPVYILSSLPIFIKRILAFILAPFNPNHSKRLQYFCGMKNVAGWWDIVKQTKAIQTLVIENWQENKLDGVICPVLASPAVSNGASVKLTTVASYAAIINVLDFVAGCVPVTKVTEEDEAAVFHYPELSATHKILKQDSKGTEGLPVVVQVVTLPWQEEKCLKIMKEIEVAIKSLQKV